MRNNLKSFEQPNIKNAIGAIGGIGVIRGHTLVDLLRAASGCEERWVGSPVVPRKAVRVSDRLTIGTLRWRLRNKRRRTTVYGIGLKADEQHRTSFSSVVQTGWQAVRVRTTHSRRLARLIHMETETNHLTGHAPAIAALKRQLAVYNREIVRCYGRATGVSRAICKCPNQNQCEKARELRCAKRDSIVVSIKVLRGV